MHGQASANVLQVTAAQYCDFLNQNAASDSNCFYDEHMASDPSVALIVREATPGRWHYEVIAGRENIPVCYVNGFDTACYNAMSVTAEDEKNFDGFLKSNHTGCTADRGENAETLSVASDPSQEKNHSFFSEATITKIGLIFLGVTMMKEGVRPVDLSEAADMAHQNSLRLASKSKFTRRSGESILEVEDKTMDHLHPSPTQKSYGALESSYPREETKKDSFTTGKLAGVEMAVLRNADRLISDQKPPARKNISMEEFSFSPSDSEEKKSFKTLQRIKAELKEVQQGRDKEALLREAERSAEDVVIYAKVCQRGNDVDSLSNLAILDKFKEALTLRLKAVEHSANFEVRNYYSEAANNSELAACYAEGVQNEKNPLIAKQLNAAVSLAEAAADSRKKAAEATLSKNRTSEHYWVETAFAFEAAFSFRRYASYAIRDGISDLVTRYVAAAEEAEIVARDRQAIAMGQAESQVPDDFFSNLREELSKKYALPENFSSDQGLALQQPQGLSAGRSAGGVSSNPGVVPSLRKLASSTITFGKGNNGYERIPDDNTAAAVNLLHVPNHKENPSETTPLLKRDK